MNLEKRSIGWAIFFSIITIGLYGLYWQMRITDEAHTLCGRRTCASGGMAVVYTVCSFGIYFFYWVYKIGEEMNLAKGKRGMQYDDNSPMFFLVMTLFGFGFIPVILFQSGINDMIANDYGEYDDEGEDEEDE